MRYFVESNQILPCKDRGRDLSKEVQQCQIDQLR